MMGLIKRWRRTRATERSRIDNALWERVLDGLPFLARLSDDDLLRLRQTAALFLDDKQMHGASGFVLTDEIRLSIAVQACLPILNLGLDAYAGWVGIVVYPAEFRVIRSEPDDDGVVHEWSDELAGESWPGGPIVLSWEDIYSNEPGYNVVIHEFAHKLDMLSGDADGIPPAPQGYAPEAWRDLLGREYERFCAEADAAAVIAPVGGQESESETIEIDFDFDPYAAEHPAEFFAVMSEAFFTEPEHVRERYPALYTAFTALYRQDPAARTGR